MTQILKENFPQATAIKVTDISGKTFLSSFLQSLVGFCPRVPEGRGLDRGNLPSRPLNMCGLDVPSPMPAPGPGRAEMELDLLSDSAQPWTECRKGTEPWILGLTKG